MENSGFRPPSAFIRASLARQNKVKSLRTASENLSDAPTNEVSPTHNALKHIAKLDKLPLSKFSSPVTIPSVPATSKRQSHHTPLAPNQTATTSPGKTKTDSTPITTPSKTALEIAKLKAARDSRRAAAAEIKSIQDALCPSEKETRIYRTEINAFRKQFAAVVAELPEISVDGSDDDSRIRVCVRKRPMNKKELAKESYDIVTTATTRFPHSQVYVHEPKTRVDMSKYIETHSFILDHSFDETSTNEQVYLATGKPLVKSIFEGGMCTFFAYGQTGSGKTHTIFGNPAEPGIYSYTCRDIFSQINTTTPPDQQSPHLRCSFFEIYGPKINDLLNPNPNAAPITLCEDKHGSVNLMNLHEEIVTSLSSLLSLVQRGRSLRTTRATNANSESSRSHALFQIRIVSNDGYLIGVLSLVDLAGSERGVDSISFTAKPDKKTQSEAAEINKSLLSLKECIRALYKRGLDEENGHVPFRGSKLTHILRDSFLCRESRTVMVATISPGSTSVEHTLNTLRYADRVKELGKDGSSYSSVKPVVLATGGGKKSETQSTGTPKAESSSPRHETRSERPVDAYEAADDEQQSIAALQHDRNLVSSLGNYGQSDSEEESLDQALRQASMAQRKVKVESHYDMNALRDQIKNSQSARTADRVQLNQTAIPNSIDQVHLFGNKEPGDVAVELPNLGNEIKRKEEQREDEEDEVETEESSNEDSDFFYQDALSVSGATAGESEEEGEENDADEKEWRKYCTSSARQTDSDTEVSLRTRHLFQVQQQLMEIDQLLLERVRSGRMGAGAYITQLSELLGQRVDALRRASQ